MWKTGWNLLAGVLAIGLGVGQVHAQPVQRSAAEAGTRYLGAVSGQDWGRPIATGDLDGDGYDEVIVAASTTSAGIFSRVYVLRGGPGRHGLGTVDLAVTAADQVIVGAAAGDNLGASIATGDINGDLVDDLLLCASAADLGGLPGRGIAYLIFGGPGFFNAATRDMSISTDWDLRVLGPVAGGDMGGSNLFGGLDAQGAAIGRINDDIYGDLILGVHLADGGGSQAGRVYVKFGGPFPSGFTLNLAVGSDYNVRIDGDDSLDELGTTILTGDLTGDGIEELILPNEYAGQGLFTSEGAVHIFRGRASWPSSISLASVAADITLLGAREDDNLGSAAVVGDFNGDGITDLASAAPGADAGAFNDQRGDGFVYGLLGGAGYQTGTQTIDYAVATPDFLLVGDFEENLGAEVAAGDFNGDGIDDLAASERFAGPNINGVVEVLFGRTFAAGATYFANVDTDLRIQGGAQERIGFSLSAGDVNGDDLDEILFGTPFNNGNAGTAWVFTPAEGDVDIDGDHDLHDFLAFQVCFTGASGPVPTAACALLDMDLDEDVDLTDWAAFEAQFTGPGF